MPQELKDKFQDFDLTEAAENDIMSNLGMSFKNLPGKEFSQSCKVLMNNLIKEGRNQFSFFEKFLREKVFVENARRTEEMSGKALMDKSFIEKKIGNYKIGRKLPENTPEYDLNSDVQFDLKTP